VFVSSNSTNAGVLPPGAAANKNHLYVEVEKGVGQQMKYAEAPQAHHVVVLVFDPPTVAV